MDKIIPILPCPSIMEQVAFYENLGFTIVQTYTRPNPYAVVQHGSLEIHFYGSKKTLPAENPSMCYLRVDDVSAVHEAFSNGLKQNLGKIPRSGIPRISKLKDLKEDSRFMVTDMGGNTLFIGTPNAEVNEPPFFRTIESAEYAEKFAILYDLLYSKEDSATANNMRVKFFPEDLSSMDVGGLDMAKISLAALDLHLQHNHIVDPRIDGKLKELLDGSDRENSNWRRIWDKYDEILGG
ncbi:hypothetical protein [Paenibacillus harenae]|uniref:VOC family protein n=1 Tax=Paenibacillus harenae TaxID=306543 RepID=A0ABT9U2G7_PAEHA|nr:hypothetical protein [Paenibacillus harenae]MDQ0113820.1 hypothetical protein [Paenibacillus harenae]